MIFVKAYPCSSPDCILSFDDPAKLERHEAEDLHTSLTDMQDPVDRTKLLMAEFINRGRGKLLFLVGYLIYTFAAVAAMNHIAHQAEEIQETGTSLKQGWALKLSNRGGSLPAHVS